MKPIYYFLIVILLFGIVGYVEMQAEKEREVMKDRIKLLEGRFDSMDDRYIIQEANTEAILTDYYEEMFE